MTDHQVLPRHEWIEARPRFLAKEREFTRLREELSRERRELPWERVEKNYVSDGPTGRVTLNDLFVGKSQLVVYHLMFAPDSEAACRGCSFRRQMRKVQSEAAGGIAAWVLKRRKRRKVAKDPTPAAS